MIRKVDNPGDDGWGIFCWLVAEEIEIFNTSPIGSYRNSAGHLSGRIKMRTEEFNQWLRAWIMFHQWKRGRERALILTKREEYVLDKRRPPNGKAMTFREIGEELGVSTNRAQQIFHRATEKNRLREASS
jgi:hypothetical protein